jgi:hypothetical protein
MYIILFTTVMIIICLRRTSPISKYTIVFVTYLFCINRVEGRKGRKKRKRKRGKEKKEKIHKWDERGSNTKIQSSTFCILFLLKQCK